MEYSYLEHVCARGAHDPDPALCALKCIFSLRRPLGPSFEVGEWLEDQDLETQVVALLLHFLRRRAEVVVVGGLHFFVKTAAGEGEEVGERKFDGLEAGGGDGFKFRRKRVAGLANGAGGVAGGDMPE